MEIDGGEDLSAGSRIAHSGVGALSASAGPEPGKGESACSTTVYTDGSCLGNPGPGGWAWAVPAGAFASGSEKLTTNQRMEVTAVLEALRSISGPVAVVSDSTYVVNCFRQGWWKGWLARGWRNSKGDAVANQDLWRHLLEEVELRGPGQVSFRWVKGHSNSSMNAMVDRLALEAAQNQVGRSGTSAGSR